MKNLAVLVSGTGSLLESMIVDQLLIDLVLADRPCRGLDIARDRGIETVLLERKEFGPTFDREGYTIKLFDILKLHNIEIVAMAGFDTILHHVIFEMGYAGRIMNTHPALLPLFRGHHAVRDALAAGATTTGFTIHIATKNVDEGEILAQESVPIYPGDTEQIVHTRIKHKERVRYPEVIRAFSKRFEVD